MSTIRAPAHPPTHHRIPQSDSPGAQRSELHRSLPHPPGDASLAGVISDPLEAQQEITMVAEGYGDADGSNEEVVHYFKWLEEIQAKVC